MLMILPSCMVCIVCISRNAIIPLPMPGGPFSLPTHLCILFLCSASGIFRAHYFPLAASAFLLGLALCAQAHCQWLLKGQAHALSRPPVVQWSYPHFRGFSPLFFKLQYYWQYMFMLMIFILSKVYYFSADSRALIMQIITRPTTFYMSNVSDFPYGEKCSHCFVQDAGDINNYSPHPRYITWSSGFTLCMYLINIC